MQIGYLVSRAARIISMTDQQRNKILLAGVNYDIIRAVGEGLFDPHAYSLTVLKGFSTALQSGFWTQYQIDMRDYLRLSALYAYVDTSDHQPDLFGVSPEVLGSFVGYEGLFEPIRFSGSLLLVHDVEHNGPIWSFKLVKELVLSDGRSIELIDHSEQMKQIRQIKGKPLMTDTAKRKAMLAVWDQSLSGKYPFSDD